MEFVIDVIPFDDKLLNLISEIDDKIEKLEKIHLKFDDFVIEFGERQSTIVELDLNLTKAFQEFTSL